MDTQTHVLLALESSDESRTVADGLDLTYDITLDTVYSRYDIFECISDFHYNIIIIDDALLRRGDTERIIHDTANDDLFTPKPEIILLSHELTQSTVLEEDDESVFVFKAPASASFLLQLIRRAHIVQLYRSADAMRRRESIYDAINGLFSALGMQMHSPGVEYLREAVYLYIQKPEMLDAVTKTLYPALARKNGTSAAVISRQIRQAINECLIHGDLDAIRALFGFMRDRECEHITSAQFISCIGFIVEARTDIKELEKTY